jgi:kynurenine formamidase
MIGKIIDLSMTIEEGLSGTISEVKVIQEMTRQWSGRHFKEPCVGWESRSILISEHCGTHVDAPYHYVPNTKTIDQVPLSYFVGDAVLVDLRNIQRAGKPITKGDLVAFCEGNDLDIRKGDIVILFSETDAKGLTDEAVDWLVEREIKGVGTNISVEEERVEEGRVVRTAHVNFLSRGISIYEGLVNLEKIGKNRFTFIGLPLKIRSGTGSPVRAIALVQDE